MLDICKKLFNCWNESNVRYCHWKSNEHLDKGLIGGTDLDVYVYPEDKEKANELLKKTEYVKFKPQKGCVYDNVDEWLGFDTITGRLVHIHLHFQIITGTKYCKEYVFPLDDEIISTRVLDPITNVYVTLPELEIIILYSRIALKSSNKKRIKPNKDSVKEIDFLKSKIQLDQLAEECDKAFGNNVWSSQMYGFIIKPQLSYKEWNSLYLLVSKWLKPYKKYGGLKVFLRHNCFKYRHLLLLYLNKRRNHHHIDLKTLPNNGLSVCFIGQDGCGKSTLSKDICKWLNWKVAAHRFYLGSGDGRKSFSKTLSSKTNKKPVSSSSIDTDNTTSINNCHLPIKTRFRKLCGKFIGCLSLKNVAKHAYKELVEASKYKNCGAIAVFDRFPQIQFSGLYDGPKIKEKYGEGSWFTKKMSRKELSYLEKAQDHQPDLMFKLVLTPEESIKRKPHDKYDAIIKKSQITPLLVFPQSEVYTIDASQDYNKELLQIKTIIWEKILQTVS